MSYTRSAFAKRRNKGKHMKAVIYARYSSDLQRQASIEDQFRNCLSVIEHEGWELVGKYSDEAMSGANADRSGYQALLEAAKRKDFDVIVVDEVSRLWRDQEEQWRAVKRLEFYQIHIRGANDGVNTLSEGFGLLLSIRGAINEEARREIGKRTHRGLTGQALNGHNCGGKSYGYRHIPIEDPTRRDYLGRPVVVAVRREIEPEQAKWVRKIFEWYADGQSPRSIADKLNSLGVPPPGANWNRRARQCRGWSGSAIYGDLKRGFGILCNPLYVGRYIWNRTQRLIDPDTKTRKHVPRPREEWIVQEKSELRVVSQELWERVQTRLRTQRNKSGAIREALHKNARTGRGPKYLFSGLLKCAVCGGNFIIVNEHSYGCGTHKDRGPHVCSNNLKVPRRVVEAKLLESIKHDLFTEPYIRLFKQETAKLLAERKRKITDKKAIDRKLAKAEQEIDNLLSAIKAGIVTASTKSELEKLEAERERLLSQLKVDTRKLDKVGHILPRAVDRFKEIVDNLETVTLRDVARARTQIGHLLGEITLHAKNGYLEAELAGDFAGMLKLAEINLVPRRGLEPPRGCPH